ncbi:MAG: hypothetical protein ACI30S_03125 [Muribaculaceae bacterium]
MKNMSFKQNSFETVKCDSPSHNGMCCNDQASSLRSLPGLKHDCSTSGAAGRWKPMQKCSQVCVICVSRPSLYKARYQGYKACHRVRSLRDLTPKCLRHVGKPRLTSGREASRPYDKVVEISRIHFGRETSRPYDKVLEISGIHFGREASRPYDKMVEISRIHFGREASRPYDKMVEISRIHFGGDVSCPCDKVVEISGICFGREASRRYSKEMEISGLVVCGVERGGRMANMLSRGRFRRDLRRRLQRRGMRHLRSP